MAKLPKGFRASKHEKMRNVSAVPAGKYAVKISDSEYVQNSNKNGHILKLQFDITKGKYKGQKLFSNLNLDNPSDKAVEIAEQEFATICDAVGLGDKIVRDTATLHGKVLAVRATYVPAQDGYNEKNEIKMYWPISELEENDEDENESSGTDTKTVIKLARKVKKKVTPKKFKKLLGEYDISAIDEINDLDEDDLDSLSEDLEEAME